MRSRQNDVTAHPIEIRRRAPEQLVLRGDQKCHCRGAIREKRRVSPLDRIVFVAFLTHDPDVATSIPLSASAARPTILVVDDEPSTQRTLDRLLAFYRFAPRQASNIQDATLIAEREPVDAFVVDLTLGREESGMDMVAWLRRQRGYAMAPVFVLTSDLDIPDRDRTLIRQHGAHLFYKGQSLELLIDRLQQILADSTASVSGSRG